MFVTNFDGASGGPGTAGASFDVKDVLSRLQTGFVKQIRYRPETDSTNDEAKVLAKAGAPEGVVVVSDVQRKGRGRRGRNWADGPGQSLLFSVVVRPDIPPPQAPLLVFAAGAAVRTALLPYGETFIKWPNDVVTRDGRKLCGILVELDADRDKVHHCVVGIGINVGQSPEDFPPDLRGKAGSVAQLIESGSPLPVPRREPLLAAVLDEFGRRLARAAREGFEPLLEEIRNHSATVGREVRVHEAVGTEWNGTAVDIAPDGALLVRKPGEAEPVPVYAAEVSIRMEVREHGPS